MDRSAGSWPTMAFLGLSFITSVACQAPSSYPHSYPGMPTGGFGPQWQECTCPVASVVRSSSLWCSLDFQVTKPLPNVTFPVGNGRMFAGNIPVQRPGHDNDTLFFVAVENSKNSLTSSNSSEPWGIWLNGGSASLNSC
jgi:carboxypeptidase D